jgi:hypothetical protein
MQFGTIVTQCILAVAQILIITPVLERKMTWKLVLFCCYYSKEEIISLASE